MNPFADAFRFLLRPWWPILILWLLMLGSIGIAAFNLRQSPEQRTGRHIWMWITRVFIGALWWLQSLWKLPPTYTDNPDGVSGGLHHWVGEMAKYAAFGPQSAFIKEVVQPHFYFFAPQVYAVEVVIAVSLLLGLWARLGGTLGALMALNLWLGLYRAPYEWPWTYFFLFLLQGTFAVLRAGRSLGADAILVRRTAAAGGRKTGLAQLLECLT